MSRRWTALCLLSTLAPLLTGTPAIARELAPMVTFVEGPSVLVSAARGFMPAPGVRLRGCDILSTGPKALVQLEFDDGGIIVVGPDSRLVVGMPGGGDAGIGPQFLVSGWVKLSVPKRDKSAPHRIDTSAFEMSVDDGAVALRTTAGGGQFFVERGAAMALTRSSNARQSVVSGRSYTRLADQPQGAVTSGAEPGFVKDLPRTLRDSLPSMMSHLKARDVPPKPAAGYSHAQTETWLNAVPELRPCFADSTIRNAQEALQKKGFDIGQVDGLLGPRTMAALREFQQQHGLARSGQLDAETLKALGAVEKR